MVAALAHAGRPLTVPDVAAALGWSRDRTGNALDAIISHPAIADPFALQPLAPETYTLTTRPDRSSARQRAALER